MSAALPVDARHDRRSIYLGLAIFVFTFAVNLLNADSGLAPVTFPDTDSYLRVMTQILHGELPYLHSRTPGYPMFLLIARATGSWEHIVIVQALFGAVAAIALWQILQIVLRSETWAAVAAAILTAEYASGWHGLALTESLSMSFLILWSYAHLVDIGVGTALPRRLRPYYRWIALALDLILMMLRPAFFFLPACWYVLLLVLRPPRMRIEMRMRTHAINLGIVVFAMLAWSGMIWARYGRFEITIVSRYNRLGNLMALGYASSNVCERRTCSPLARRGVELASADTIQSLGPYVVSNQLAAEFPGVSRGAALDTLNDVLAPRFGRMEFRALKRMAFMFSQDTWYGPAGRMYRTRVHRAFSTYVGVEYRKLSFFALAWAALFVVLAYRFKHGNDEDVWVRFTLLFASVYLAGVNALGAYADFARLMAPAIVPVNVLILWLLVDLVRGAASRFQAAKSTP
jgi:hypothetical protein